MTTMFFVQPTANDMARLPTLQKLCLAQPNQLITDISHLAVYIEDWDTLYISYHNAARLRLTSYEERRAWFAKALTEVHMSKIQ